MSPVLVRPTRPDDVAAVLAMEADPGTRPWLGGCGPGWHADALADPGVEHLLGLYDGRVVGFVVLAAPRGEEPGSELRRIVVDADRRGAGHGRALLRAVLDRVPGRIWLDVKPDNVPARTLYASEGFVVERERPVMILARNA